jgi:glycosyltransferase involved in cell wall biosynthesis
VIATNVGALPGTVGAGGLVVPDGDFEALAEAIEQMAGDPARRAAAAAAGRKRAMEEFSNEVLARRNFEFWRSATGAVSSAAHAAAV